jgi:hypothetical protein
MALWDVFEQNNCRPRCGMFIGTSPATWDTDGDLLNDYVEGFGYPGLDLPAMDVNPLKKTVLLEIDWADDNANGTWHSHRPTDEAIAMIVAAFANAPVMSACGESGVQLIVDYGQGGAFTGGNHVANQALIAFHQVPDSDYYILKGQHFAAARNGFFHYSIHCHQYNTGGPGGGIAESVPGDDHMVCVNYDADHFWRALVTMHELGHCLGLHHGGGDTWNLKPNYNSIMNYLHQLGADGNCDVISDYILDYSHGLNAPLDENALNEEIGVCGGVPIDWNNNGFFDPFPVARNVNCGLFPGTLACGQPGCWMDPPGTCNVLHDYNDWAIMNFSGIWDADFTADPPIECDFDLAP